MPPSQSQTCSFLRYSIWNSRKSFSSPQLQLLRPHISLPRHPRRPYSTPSLPSLIQTTDIPAPHTGHIRILSLSSPRNKNAISTQLLWELSSQIRAVQAETQGEWQRFVSAQERPPNEKEAKVGQGTRALIIASAVPDIFCAGADLKQRRDMTAAETSTFLTTLRQALSDLSNLPIPTISAIAGPALGGGFELALATTFRFMSPSSIVGLPETRLGIIPGAGGTWRLRKLVGEKEALRLVLTGKKMRAAECRRVGVVDGVTFCGREDGERELGEGTGDGVRVDGVDGRGKGRGEEERVGVLEMAVDFAREICEGGPVAVMAALRAVRMGREGGQGTDGEEETYEVVRRTRDRDEALAAFKEKRAVRFKGH